jgi:Protein of unknown function (DUF559)
MAKVPISFHKIKTKDYKNNEFTKYLIIVSEKNSSWEKTAIVDVDDIIKLRDELDKLLQESSTSEILKISEHKALKVDNAHQNDTLCKNCEFKMSHNCLTCLFELQSPLERKLFLELRRSKIHFDAQYGLNWKGQSISVVDKSYGHPTNNFKDVLTVVDFYIEAKNVKLCIYTDGHTYHERTEEQASRDRNIDRKLQELGFQVLRYTGKDVLDNTKEIIEDIKKWTEKGYR